MLTEEGRVACAHAYRAVVNEPLLDDDDDQSIRPHRGAPFPVRNLRRKSLCVPALHWHLEQAAMSLQPSYAGQTKGPSRRPRLGAERFFLDVSLSRKRQFSVSVFLPRYVAYGSRLCENALGDALGLAFSTAAAVKQRVEFLGEGPAPYAFIAAISGPAPRILIARFRL